MHFKGRLILKEYIPQKRARFGLKVFFVCDAKIGYSWDILEYTIQEEEQQGGGDFYKNL
jgi:hypothetical protein